MWRLGEQLHYRFAMQNCHPFAFAIRRHCHAFIWGSGKGTIECTKAIAVFGILSQFWPQMIVNKQLTLLKTVNSADQNAVICRLQLWTKLYFDRSLEAFCTLHGIPKSQNNSLTRHLSLLSFLPPRFTCMLSR